MPKITFLNSTGVDLIVTDFEDANNTLKAGASYKSSASGLYTVWREKNIIIAAEPYMSKNMTIKLLPASHGEPTSTFVNSTSTDIVLNYYPGHPPDNQIVVPKGGQKPNPKKSRYNVFTINNCPIAEMGFWKFSSVSIEVDERP